MYSKTKKLYSDRKIIRVNAALKDDKRNRWEEGVKREEEGGRRGEGWRKDEEEKDERMSKEGEWGEEGARREEGRGRKKQFVSYSKVDEKKRTFLFDYQKEVELANKEDYKYREEQKEKWLSRTFKF